MVRVRPQLRVRLNLLPRRLHWSVTVEDDTTSCYNATEETAAQLATRFQHGMSGSAAKSPGARGQLRRQQQQVQARRKAPKGHG